MVTGWPNLSNPADGIFFFILGISIILLFLITAVMVYFVFKYSRNRHPVPEDVKDSLALEIVWTVIPTILVLVIFFVGWKGFQFMRTVPADAMPVKVTAGQFSWTFHYENGIEDTVLRVPVQKPIKLLITSADVLHSLSIPAYRIKEDAVPGRQTYLWFLPDEIGSYDLFCTEYCGVAHANMTTKVNVMSEPDFKVWYEAEKISDSSKKVSGKTDHEHTAAKPNGASLFQAKGCIACHSIDGTQKVGPGLKGIFGKKETVIRGGSEQVVVIDEEFIEQKLLQPEISRIKGFPPIMPSLQGQLTDAELRAIIEYLKGLK